MTKNIWPRQLPDSVRTDPRCRAEVKVYDRLACQLPDEYHVFYSSPWLAIDRFGNERDGECDFIVAHKRLGILAIEVKGGGIDFDPGSDQWTSTDKLGVVHNIRDPVGQARSTKHQILDKLRNSGKWTRKWITLRHGVIFPDAATPPGGLGADRPAGIFCANRQFRSDLVGWIKSRLHDSSEKNRSGEGLGRDGIAALESLFAYPFTLSFRISATISEDIQELDLLEPQQFLVLDYISNIPRARIEGAAGTGKTVLALEAATRSGKDGERTLLTCYNPALANELRRRLGNAANLTVMNFHSLCLSLADTAGLPIEQKMEDQSYFEDYLPELLMKSLNCDETQRFDRIIVDEGQDFADNWWIAIDEALTQDGSIRVFFDSNQRLYNRNYEFLNSLDLAPIPLNRNLRNTKRIHQASMVHYSGPGTTAIGPSGIELKWIETEDGLCMANAAFDEVKRMVYREELDPADIAVLVPNREARDAFMVATARSGLSFTDAETTSSEAVVVDTVRRYKGLERPAVILCIAGAKAGLTELAYTGMTRARAALSIVCQPKDRHWIENGR